MSEYTDIRNNTYQIHQRSLVNTSQAEQQKQEIIEELSGMEIPMMTKIKEMVVVVVVLTVTDVNN